MTTERIDLLSFRYAAATAATLGLALFGCASNDAGVDPTDVPLEAAHVAALSAYGASLGSLVEVYGTGFPVTGDSSMHIVLDGTFDTGDSVEPVHLEVPVRVIDQGTALWNTFGPYAVPFGSSGSELGRFEGTIGTIIEDDRGEVLAEDLEPTPMTFEVEPSIRVREFQPIAASCAGPIRRALGGAPYRLTVEALGFTPTSFTYTLTAPGLDEPPIAVRHIATGPVDSAGNDLELTLPVVPRDRLSYGLAVSVQAVDNTGRSHQSVFSLTVHRPIEVYYNGNVIVAELLPPVPVSGCIPGGEVGRQVNYSETNTETRDRRIEFNWNQHWMDSHMVSEGTSDTIGLNERNGVGFATTDGQSFSWNLGAEFGASQTIGVSELVSLGFSQKISAGIGGDRSHSQTSSSDYSQGLDASTTTTEQVSDTETVGGGEGGALAMTVSSSDTVSRSFNALVIARLYGVFYRQTTRLIRRAGVVTYNQCGAASVIGDLELEDWTWSPDLAEGRSCPPFPQSNLPQAACYMSPCAGE